MSRQERDGAFVGANGPSIELVYGLILDDLHELFQRNAVRPSTRSMLPQLSLLNMLLYFALSCLLFSKKNSMCMLNKPLQFKMCSLKCSLKCNQRKLGVYIFLI